MRPYRLPVSWPSRLLFPGESRVPRSGHFPLPGEPFKESPTSLHVEYEIIEYKVNESRYRYQQPVLGVTKVSCTSVARAGLVATRRPPADGNQFGPGLCCDSLCGEPLFNAWLIGELHVMVIVLGSVWGYILGPLLAFLSVFLMLLILIQRGRGGGLIGALGGPGGQSAFGTKAGDIFTRITVATFCIWLLLCLLTIALLNNRSQFRSTSGGKTAKSSGGELQPGTQQSPASSPTTPDTAPPSESNAPTGQGSSSGSIPSDAPTNAPANAPADAAGSPNAGQSTVPSETTGPATRPPQP